MPVTASRRSSTALVVVVVPWTMRSIASMGKPAASSAAITPMRLVVDGGRRLGDAHLAVAAVDQDQVGEGAADIDAGDDASPRLRDLSLPSSKSGTPELRTCR